MTTDAIANSAFMAIEFAKDILGAELSVAASVLFASIAQGGKIAVFAGRGRLNAAEAFVSGANETFSPYTGQMSAIRVGRDQTLAEALGSARCAAAEFEAVVASSDALLISVGPYTSQEDGSLPLLDAAKQRKIPTVIVSEDGAADNLGLLSRIDTTTDSVIETPSCGNKPAQQVQEAFIFNALLGSMDAMRQGV